MSGTAHSRADSMRLQEVTLLSTTLLFVTIIVTFPGFRNV